LENWFEAYLKPHLDKKSNIKGPTFSDTNHALEAAEQGMGVALIPNFLVERALLSGSLVQAMDDQYQLESKSAFYIITAREVTSDTSIGKVIDWLLDEAKLND
jgi:LysR family glycine cleavage system transcriptional activator